MAVSDGSMKYGKGTFAAVFADYMENFEYTLNQVETGRVPGNPGTISSFQAEAQGAAAVFLKSGLNPKKFLCDNEAFLDALTSTSPLPPLTPEWDIIEPTRQSLKKLMTTCQHVKGYQDDDIEYKMLSPMAELNVQADRKAKKALTLPYQEILTPGHRSTVFINNSPFTTKYQEEIRRSFASDILHQYYDDKHNLSPNDMQ